MKFQVFSRTVLTTLCSTIRTSSICVCVLYVQYTQILHCSRTLLLNNNNNRFPNSCCSTQLSHQFDPHTHCVTHNVQTDPRISKKTKFCPIIILQTLERSSQNSLLFATHNIAHRSPRSHTQRVSVLQFGLKSTKLKVKIVCM